LKFSCVRRVSSLNCSWGLDIASLLLWTAAERS
jgi:hypothetical protein